MTREIELAKQHGIAYRHTPEGPSEMWCHDRQLQAFAEALMATERERCATVCEGVREAADHAARDGHRKAGAMASAALCAKLIRA